MCVTAQSIGKNNNKINNKINVAITLLKSRKRLSNLKKFAQRDRYVRKNRQFRYSK